MDKRMPFLQFILGQTTKEEAAIANPYQKTLPKAQVTITLPWRALVQDLDLPYTGSTQSIKFVPIRNTTNKQAYMLGRTFFQNAYVTVDYERRIFAVGQALYPSADEQSIVRISAANDTSSEYSATSKVKAILPVKAIAGAAAALSILILLLALLFFLRKSKRRRHHVAEHAVITENESVLQYPLSRTIPSEKCFDVVELSSGVVFEADGFSPYLIQELGSPQTPRTELPDESTISKTFGRCEMDATPPASTNNALTGTMDTVISESSISETKRG
jgi:hypothetical protein